MSRRELRACLLLGLLLVSLLKPATADEVRTSEAGKAAPVAQEYVDFARKLEQSIAAGDGTFMDSNFDVDILTDRVLGGRGLSESVLEQQKARFALAMRTGRWTGEEIARAVKDGGSYKFLRFHRVGDQTRGIFRLLSKTGSMNYHDLIFVMKNGSVKIADLYIFLAGEFLSDTMRRLNLALLFQQDEGTAHKLQGDEIEYVKNLPKVQAMIHASSPEEALAIYAQLPAGVQKNKSIMNMRLKAAAAKGFDCPEYKEAMADMKSWFPDDPSLHLILIDHYFNRKEYAEALACVEAVRKAVGGDAYLDFVCGCIYLAQKKYDLAKAAHEKAIAAEPTLPGPYWNLVTIAMEQKDWAAVSQGLTRIEQNLHVRISNLENIQAYAEYVKTEEYAKWKGSR